MDIKSAENKKLSGQNWSTIPKKKDIVQSASINRERHTFRRGLLAKIEKTLPICKLNTLLMKI